MRERRCTDGSPVLVVITQADHLAASRFSAFVLRKICIIRYILHQASGRAENRGKRYLVVYDNFFIICLAMRRIRSETPQLAS
jgi:hypothetical protein